MPEVTNNNFPVDSAIQAAYLMVGNTYESVGEFINAYMNAIGIETPDNLPNHPAPPFYFYHVNNDYPSAFPSDSDAVESGGIYEGGDSYVGSLLKVMQAVGYQDGMYNTLKGQIGYITQYASYNWRFLDGYIGLCIRVSDLQVFDTWTDYGDADEGDDPQYEYYKSVAFHAIYWDPKTKTAKDGVVFPTQLSAYDKESGYPPPDDGVDHTAIPTQDYMDANGYFYSYLGYAIPEIPTNVNAVYYYGDPVFGGKLTGVTSARVSETETRFTLPETIPDGKKGAGMKFLYCQVNLSFYNERTFVHYHPGTVSKFKIIAYYGKNGSTPSKWIFYT